MAAILSRGAQLTHHILRPTIFTDSNPSCHFNYARSQPYFGSDLSLPIYIQQFYTGFKIGNYYYVIGKREVPVKGMWYGALSTYTLTIGNGAYVGLDR